MGYFSYSTRYEKSIFYPPSPIEPIIFSIMETLSPGVMDRITCFIGQLDKYRIWLKQKRYDRFVDRFELYLALILNDDPELIDSFHKSGSYDDLFKKYPVYLMATLLRSTRLLDSIIDVNPEMIPKIVSAIERVCYDPAPILDQSKHTLSLVEHLDKGIPAYALVDNLLTQIENGREEWVREKLTKWINEEVISQRFEGRVTDEMIEKINSGKIDPIALLLMEFGGELVKYEVKLALHKNMYLSGKVTKKEGVVLHREDGKDLSDTGHFEQHNYSLSPFSSDNFCYRDHPEATERRSEPIYIPYSWLSSVELNYNYPNMTPELRALIRETLELSGLRSRYNGVDYSEEEKIRLRKMFDNLRKIENAVAQDFDLEANLPSLEFSLVDAEEQSRSPFFSAFYNETLDNHIYPSGPKEHAYHSRSFTSRKPIHISNLEDYFGKGYGYTRWCMTGQPYEVGTVYSPELITPLFTNSLLELAFYPDVQFDYATDPERYILNMVVRWQLWNYTTETEHILEFLRVTGKVLPPRQVGSRLPIEYWVKLREAGFLGKCSSVKVGELVFGKQTVDSLIALINNVPISFLTDDERSSLKQEIRSCDETLEYFLKTIRREVDPAWLKFLTETFHKTIKFKQEDFSTHAVANPEVQSKIMLFHLLHNTLLMIEQYGLEIDEDRLGISKLFTNEE